MFKKFVAFWITQAKITRLFIGSILTIGVFSRLIIPKQYNPDIIVPAFQITVPAPGFTSQQSAQLLTKPLENSLMGLEGVDHVYGYSAANYAALMVAFHVGVDKEKASTRLHNVLLAYQSKLPLGAQQPYVQSIDPDDIPIFSFVVAYSGSNQDKMNIQTSLRSIGLGLIEQLKTVPDTTLWLYQGGQQNTIQINLDLDEFVSRQLDIGQAIMAIQSQQINAPVGSIKRGDTETVVNVKGAQDTLDQLKHLVVADKDERPVTLDEVASITWGKTAYVPAVVYANQGLFSQESIVIGVAKKKGTNVVKSTRILKKTLETLSKNLPLGYTTHIIQDEGAIAASTTNMLLFNLLHSIILVVVVLGLSLGISKSLNVAISIPLTLSIVFLFARIIGDNINRITLFALILVLGMLVDDAIVVVENISRHLKERKHTGKSIQDTIIDSISEVELAVGLSTFTRLLSFVAMFFVSGMMGDYMGPIPKYAIITLTTSMVIALSINPFLAWVFETKAEKIKKTHSKVGYTFLDKINAGINTYRNRLGIIYHTKMMKYLDHNASGRRFFFKLVFWSILGLAVILPIAGEVFRARMLPKSDQKQIYLWIDAGINTNIETTKHIMQDMQLFLQTYSAHHQQNTKNNNDKNRLGIIDSTTYRIGAAPMLDFSNLFRGSQSRINPHHISARINLIDQEKRKISSEQFVIQLRPLLQKFLADVYPGTKLRLLEDPPGPPTRATFLLEVTSNDIPYDMLVTDTKELFRRLKPHLDAYDVKDIGTSDDGKQASYTIQLDQQLITRLGLHAQQVVTILGVLFHGADISLMYDDTHLEPTIIHVQGDETKFLSSQTFDHILLTNPRGERIPLIQVATIIPGQQDATIYSDNRIQTTYIYGEMGNNSVIYPMIGLYTLLKDSKIMGDKYTYIGADFYGVDLENKLTKQHIRINFGGERELTMDTFRDMGVAFIIAFIAIYLMMVIQFGGFSIAGTTMIAFLLGFFGIFPGYALLYFSKGEYFSATSMIGVIALAGIAVGNAIILLEYVIILIERGKNIKDALTEAGWIRLRPILITSLTAILGATTILEDPVRSGVAWAIILGLSSSALLTTIVLPIFLYSPLQKLYKKQEKSLGTGHLAY